MTENAKVVYETTARGMGEPYKIWTKKSGIAKIFLKWTDDPGYVRAQPADYEAPALLEMAQRYDLPQERINWAAYTLANRYNGNFRLFCQDFPLTPQMAFIVAGDRFFQRHFGENETPEVETGLKVFAQPLDYHVYCMGVDVAAGSESGDYSAFAIVDWTDKERPSIAATYYANIKPLEFSSVVLAAAQKYQTLIIPESNTYGSVSYTHLTLPTNREV